MGACTAPEARLEELPLLASEAPLPPASPPGTNGFAFTPGPALPLPPGTKGLAAAAAAGVGARPGGAEGTKAGALTLLGPPPDAIRRWRLLGPPGVSAALLQHP